MNDQEIFDKIVVHLRTQKRQSYGNNPNNLNSSCCLYRNDNGLKCAAGILIPDNCYLPIMEGNLVSRLKFFIDNFNPWQIRLIEALQQVHDGALIQNWEKNFENIAQYFNLRYHK